MPVDVILDEPEDRLAACTLERAWEGKLAAQQHLEPTAGCPSARDGDSKASGGSGSLAEAAQGGDEGAQQDQ